MTRTINRVLITTMGALLTGSIVSGAAAIVKVEVLSEKVKSNKEYLMEIRKDVKLVLGGMNETKICCKKGCGP